MLITDQVAIAPCTDCVQPGRPTFYGDACGRLDHLNRLAPHVRKNSAQNLVTANNLAERLLECRDVQIAFQSHPERDVKDRRAPGELFGKPYPMLREREWQIVIARYWRDRCERVLSAFAYLLLDQNRKLFDGGRFEYAANWQFYLQRVPDAQDDLRREQGVAAEIEEVAAATDRWQSQHLAPDSRDDLLDRS